MTREELLQIAKPILFNTDMVRAILDGRKTVTRRLCKIPGADYIETDTDGSVIGIYNQYEGKVLDVMAYAPYQIGDFLYVRETWHKCDIPGDEGYFYKADDNEAYFIPRWHPSIHMPKEAARIFLKVNNVRVEQLQDMEENDAFAEGIDPYDDRCYANNGWEPTLYDPDSGGDCCPLDAFKDIWNSTIKKSDLERYGWDANPFVWVIEFERLDV